LSTSYAWNANGASRGAPSRLAATPTSFGQALGKRMIADGQMGTAAFWQVVGGKIVNLN
jgi:hypothetical protein